VLDPGRVDPGAGAGRAHRRQDHFGDGDLSHEAFFVGIGRGMIARGVAIDEIVGERGMAGQPGAAIAAGPHRRRAVAERQLEGAAGLGLALLGGGDQLVVTGQQGVEQRGGRGPPRVGAITGPHRAGQGERIERDRALRAVGEIGGG
jgi:hypothetical protein